MGLGIGEILAILGLIGAMVATWTNLNLKIKELEIKIENVNKNQIEISQRVDKNENNSREDHLHISEKLDEIMKILISLKTINDILKEKK